MDNKHQNNPFFQTIAKEDDFSRVLASFLDKRRDVLATILSLGKVVVNSHEGTISTQYSIPSGRPDIVFRAGKDMVFFEVKTELFVPLTDNQPSSYVAHLASLSSAGVLGTLLFLVPHYFRHMEELKRRISQCASLYPQVPVEIVDWKRIAHAIDSAQLPLDEPLRNFIGFMRHHFRMDERFEEGGHSHKYYYQIIDELRSYFEHDPKITAKYHIMRQKQVDGAEYNFYFVDREFKGGGAGKVWFVSVWHPFWHEYDSPVCAGYNAHFMIHRKNYQFFLEQDSFIDYRKCLMKTFPKAMEKESLKKTIIDSTYNALDKWERFKEKQH